MGGGGGGGGTVKMNALRSGLVVFGALAFGYLSLQLGFKPFLERAEMEQQRQEEALLLQSQQRQEEDDTTFHHHDQPFATEKTTLPDSDYKL